MKKFRMWLRCHKLSTTHVLLYYAILIAFFSTLLGIAGIVSYWQGYKLNWGLLTSLLAGFYAISAFLLILDRINNKVRYHVYARREDENVSECIYCGTRVSNDPEEEYYEGLFTGCNSYQRPVIIRKRK